MNGQPEEEQTRWSEQARGETEAQRLDRNLMELLQELRVAQTGVQILLAFLLTLPFAAHFDQATALQRHLYVATLLCAAAASGLLIAPVSIHRFLFRKRRKARLVDAANWLAHGGLAFLALAVVGSVYLSLDAVLGGAAARWLALATALWFLVFWYALPLVLRTSGAEDDLPDDDVAEQLRTDP